MTKQRERRGRLKSEAVRSPLPGRKPPQLSPPSPSILGIKPPPSRPAPLNLTTELSSFMRFIGAPRAWFLIFLRMEGAVTDTDIKL